MVTAQNNQGHKMKKVFFNIVVNPMIVDSDGRCSIVVGLPIARFIHDNHATLQEKVNEVYNELRAEGKENFEIYAYQSNGRKVRNFNPITKRFKGNP
jgi:hypothetical protein